MQEEGTDSIVERSPFSIDDHLARCCGPTLFLQFGDGAEIFDICTIGACSEDRAQETGTGQVAPGK